MCWLFVPGSEDSNSASTSLNPEAVSSVTWRGKLQPLQSWQRVWKTATFLQRLSGLTLPPSTLACGVASWIASLRASRVSPGLSQASDLERPTSDGSGDRSRASFATWNPALSSWKTSQACLFQDLDTFSGPWPRSGSLRSGDALAREPWAPPIGGSDCSSWPTATVNGNHNYVGVTAKAGDGLATVAKAWATPVSSEGGRTVPLGTSPTGKAPDGSKKTIDLKHQARSWTTPLASNGEKGEASNHQDLVRDARQWPTPDASVSTGYNQSDSGGAAVRPAIGRLARTMLPPGQQWNPEDGLLNPAFVEWLMGFPAGWTNCGPSEMEWSRWLQQSRSELSRLVPDSEEAA